MWKTVKALNLSEEGLAFGQADNAAASSPVGLGGTRGRLPTCVVGEPPGDAFLAPNLKPVTMSVWS